VVRCTLRLQCGQFFGRTPGFLLEARAAMFAIVRICRRNRRAHVMPQCDQLLGALQAELGRFTVFKATLRANHGFFGGWGINHHPTLTKRYKL
jgi:hypothetical protein